VQRCEKPSEIQSILSTSVCPASFAGFTGFLNREGGWVESGRAVERLTAEVVRLGGKVIPACPFKGLHRVDGATKGVICQDERILEADKVVIATGSWTASTFEGELNMGLEMRCLATGYTSVLYRLASTGLIIV
jgi:sarcosine oxidase/L-pipecolate oxidase